NWISSPGEGLFTSIRALGLVFLRHSSALAAKYTWWAQVGKGARPHTGACPTPTHSVAVETLPGMR
ncbi:MAG TPA: hypothetical protein VH744_12505, partial [Terriglobales bacterium]